MGKLKVIHFVQDISNKSGGLKSAIFNLSLGIKKKRIHPIIYTFSNVNELEDYLVNNISIRCIGDLFIFDIKRIFKFVKDFYGQKVLLGFELNLFYQKILLCI